MKQNSSLPLVLSHGLSTFGLILWLGGLVFFGAMTAPVVFPLSRAAGKAELGPQIAGEILQRFAFVSLFCAAILLVGWWLEGRILRPVGKNRRLWAAQGIFAAACGMLAIYLGLIFLPRVQKEQQRILPLIARAGDGEVLSAAEIATRAAFDVEHRRYQSLAKLNLLLLFGVFGLATWRGALESLAGVSESKKSASEHAENAVLK